MRLLPTFFSVCALVALPAAIAQVPIRNDAALDNFVIPESYIIKYKAGNETGGCRKHEEEVHQRALRTGKKGIFGRFDIPGFQGYVAEISPTELDSVAACDMIDYIEKDTVVRTAAALSKAPLTKRIMITQEHAPWGLGRISHRSRGHNDYFYSDTAGKGVRVYVIDTGVRVTHLEFEGRAVWGTNFVASSPNSDEDGHGTHVAGTIAGKTYGVAKKATLVAVKALDKTGTGKMSDLLRGLDWAVADARRRGVDGKAVINLSLSGAYTESVNDGVKAATAAGLTVVAAAGNDNDAAAHWSPSSAPTAITVGAIGMDDRRADFSNWGASVDIFAPGSGILSAYGGTDEETAVMSGTSMAAPHVAGLAAYFIAREGLSGYAAVTQRIASVATKGVGDRQGSADRIAYNAGGA